ncbi:hypothetical protein LRP67_09070 [Nocardioides sp. cx-169]|uniref:hypothetical protein n=1 Tax=Nocardioides sp. cx-169 TaxID=2899080 RepID=UPI001E4691D0|nr:hypothetical protein [Nocardioides sp. cx-169]MCD4534230.1 hypothetical protein [Nocardioides sp. cx-169]
MITNTITMTTPSNPGMASGFGMPMCGHAAFATPATGRWSVDLRGLEIVRDRAVVKGQVARVAAAYVPGTHAWSSPPC